MSGLGSVKESGLFLTLAGGFIWNRKADKDDPDYGEQTYTMPNGEEKVRSGAKYADLTGMVTNVVFRSHEEYGDNINLYFTANDTKYIVSVGLESRYFQDIAKMLLVADLSKPIFIKPYDFEADKKRRVGVSVRQDGEKLNLRSVEMPESLQREKEWFKDASKRDLKRFFDDIIDHLVDRIKKEVLPKFENQEEEKQEEKETATENKQPDTSHKVKEKAEKTEKKESGKVTPLKMKKFLKEYIAENYPEKEMPTLKGEELEKWYNLAQEVEELPFPEEEKEGENFQDAETDDNLDSELDKLM